MKKSFAVVACLAALAIFLTVQSAAAQGKLEGAWKATEITYTGPNAHTNTNPSPSVVIFTKEYYSLMVDSIDKPRPELSQNPTAEEIRTAFALFWANAGTYEVKGTVLTLHPLLAKRPGTPPDAFFTMEFNIQGNILILVDKGSYLGPAVNPFTLKLTRLE